MACSTEGMPALSEPKKAICPGSLPTGRVLWLTRLSAATVSRAEAPGASRPVTSTSKGRKPPRCSAIGSPSSQTLAWWVTAPKRSTTRWPAQARGRVILR